MTDDLGEGGFGPGKSAGYHGPIEVGMEFIWEPDLPHAFEVIAVTEIENRDGEQWICSTSKRKGRAWNNESRFREAVVRPASPGGSAPPPNATKNGPISEAKSMGDMSVAEKGVQNGAEIISGGGSAERVGEPEQQFRAIGGTLYRVVRGRDPFASNACSYDKVPAEEAEALLNDRASTADPSPKAAPPTVNRAEIDSKSTVVESGVSAPVLDPETVEQVGEAIGQPRVAVEGNELVGEPERLQDRLRALYDRLVAGGDEEGASVLDDAAWALDALDLDVHLVKHGVPGFPNPETAPSLDPLHLRNAADLADFYRKPIRLPTSAARDLANRLEASAARIAQLEGFAKEAHRILALAHQGSRPT